MISQIQKPQETYRKNLQPSPWVFSPHLGTSVASARANLASSSRTVASQSRKTSSWSPNRQKIHIFMDFYGGCLWIFMDFFKKMERKMEDFYGFLWRSKGGKKNPEPVDVAMLGDSRLGMNHPTVDAAGRAHPLQALRPSARWATLGAEISEPPNSSAWSFLMFRKGHFRGWVVLNACQTWENIEAAIFNTSIHVEPWSMKHILSNVVNTLSGIHLMVHGSMRDLTTRRHNMGIYKFKKNTQSICQC